MFAVPDSFELYYAYGSNLNIEQMRARCPNAFAVCLATLDDYELRFTRWSERRRSWVADAVPAPGKTLWGVVWAMPASDLERLDGFEGHPTAYERRRVTATHPKTGEEIECWCYFVVNRDGEGSPTAEYLETIIQGAEHFSLPEEHVEAILAAARGASAAPGAPVPAHGGGVR